MVKVSKKSTHLNNMSNIFKINIRDSKTMIGVSIVNFEHILYIITLLLSLNSSK